jgi:hypothetical protein
MNYYLNQLPRELVDYIITLTYKPQPRELLLDIKNYYITRQKIKHFYSITMKSFNESEDEAVSWVVNSLLNEINSNLPMILGFSKQTEEILLRSNLISTPEDIDLYFFILLKKPVMTQLNIILGLLNPYERNLLDYSLSAFPFEKE